MAKRSSLSREDEGIRRRKIPPEREMYVEESYQNGKSLADLASEFGCTRVVVKKTLQRRGVVVRTRGPDLPIFRDAKVCEEAKRLWLEGRTNPEIGSALGVSVDTTRRLLRRLGVLRANRRSGDRHPNWKGGRVLREDGYIYVPCPSRGELASMRLGNGYVLEHRLALAKSLGRPLLDTETVHHLDGDRTNNGVENLQLRQGAHGKHQCFQCADCGSVNIVSKFEE